VKGAVRFLFDYVSPYAYLASRQIRALAARHGRDVDAEPVLFAAMLDANGGKGPAEIPAKRDYVFKDVLRIARVLGVPIEVPATHPFNPLIALRATACLEDAGSRWLLIDAVFRATWVTGQRVEQPDVVRRIADEAGLDGGRLVEQAAADDAKARLRRTTDQAVGAGVFGVPTIIADGEMFWGVDSLPFLERALSGEQDVDPARLERWRSVVPSAVRRSSS
jgi:2-hydroxychromene-2-carboxylate isomerase